MAARAGRRALAVVITIAVLLALAAVLDEVARRVVERQAAAQLQQRLGTSQPLAVQIGGWPFAAALVTGTVSTLTVTSPQLAIERTGARVTASDVDLVARDVHDVRHPLDAVAGTLDLYATVSWAVVSERGGATITSAGGDRAKFTGTVDLLGAQVAISISAVPAIDPSTHRLVLREPTASLAGVDLPSAALASAAESVAARISLPAPEGFTYESVQATGAGLRVHLRGTDVHLDRLP